MPAIDVRPYESRDMGQMIELIKRALPTLPNYSRFSVDEARFAYVLKHNLTNAMIYITVATVPHDGVVGLIAAFAQPTLFSNDIVASDIFMYIDPKWRGEGNVAKRFLEGYITWANARGAKLIIASHTSGLNAEGMDAFLKRQGFENVGAIYHLKPR